MKRFQIKQGCVTLLCMAALLGFSGCNNEDDPPDNISGAWMCTFTRGGETHQQKIWNFVQSGQNVSGSYTFDVTTWSFTGTYVEGQFNGIDADNWVLHLVFEEDSATGTVAGDGEIWTADLTR
jgi:hypothetical protein